MYLNEALYTDFLNDREILWLGIDFSKARFTKKDFNITQEVLRYYLNEWNLLIISDQKKYDIRLSFRKPVMSYDLSLISKCNKTVKINNILHENITLNDLQSEESICNYVRSLEMPQQHRFALMFIVESFDTNSKTGSVWVVVTETSSKEPVLCEKFIKNPSGFGVKNYWARIFYNVLFDIKSYAFCRWENLVKKNE
ncbi:MAG: hypothetical protein MJZ70_04445 [Bacteroidales bacterium]|nr:hypothetical protein [Bacteroidales bacterium]